MRNQAVEEKERADDTADISFPEQVCRRRNIQWVAGGWPVKINRSPALENGQPQGKTRVHNRCRNKKGPAKIDFQYLAIEVKPIDNFLMGKNNPFRSARTVGRINAESRPVGCFTCTRFSRFYAANIFTGARSFHEQSLPGKFKIIAGPFIDQ